MCEIDKIISEYTIGDPNLDKVWLLKNLEEYDDPRVIDFLLNILVDEQEEETARIEVLEFFKLKEKLSEDIRNKIAFAILSVLKDSVEDLVLNYAAMSLRSFIEVDNVLSTLEEIVSNLDLDGDLRYNALDSIESNIDKGACFDSLKRLSMLPDLGSGIRNRFRF